MSILSKIIETTVAQFVPDKKRDALSYAHRIIGKPVSRGEELRQTSDKLTVWNKSIQKHSRRNFLGASLATLALGVSCSPQKEREKEMA